MIDWADGAGVLTVGGQVLEYACWGPGPAEAPTCVLLHEGLGCVALWRDFPARLAEATGWGVFAWSRAGYGQSDPVALPRPLDYMTREAALVSGILDTVGAEHAVLIGHSDGATIAAIHAGTAPHPAMRGLVLMAPHFFTETEGLAEIARAREAFATTDLPAKLGKYHRNPENAFRGWNDAWLDPGFRDWDVTGALDGLSLPVLAVQGRDDPYGTLAQIDVIAGRSPAPVDKLILDDCRHAPHLEQPERTLAGIAGFLAGLAP